MLIICSGMLRSGSTLQYNIARLLVTKLQVGSAEGFISKKGLERFKTKLRDWESATPYHVIKSHIIQPEWMETSSMNRCYLYIYRDLRDVAVSIKNKFGHEGDKLILSLDNAIDGYEKISKMSKKNNVCWQKYEDVVRDIPNAIMEQASFLKLKPDHRIKQEIVQECSINHVNKITRKLQSNYKTKLYSFFRKLHMSVHTFDNESLYHPGHISKNNGAIGVWKSELSKGEIDIIESRYNSWLRTHSYLET